MGWIIKTPCGSDTGKENGMKKIHSGRSLIILYIIILILASCNYSSYDIIEQSSVSYDDDEIIIQEVQTMELQPIKEYAKYVTSGNRVYGINGDKLEEIVLKDAKDNQHLFKQFFILDGMIYLSIVVLEQGEEIPDTDPVQHEAIQKEYFFSQTGKMIDEELEKDFPSLPASEHIEYSDSLFQVVTFPYEVDEEMTDTSRVIRGGTPEGYLKIDGCARVSGGFWFSVPEPIMTRLQGVYLWREMGAKNRVLTEGRIW